MTSPPPQWTHPPNNDQRASPPQWSHTSSPHNGHMTSPPSPTKVTCPHPLTLHVRSPDVNNVTDKDVAILLIEINPLYHQGLGLGTIVDLRATVTGRHPVPKVLCQRPLILQQVLGEGLKCGGVPPTMVVYQGDLHPPLGGDEVEGVIVHGLATDGEVLPARQAELVLVVTHPYLVGPVVEVPVGIVEEDVVLFELHKELPLEAVLPVQAVLQVPMVGVVVGGAWRPPVGAVRLEHGEATAYDPRLKYAGNLV